MGPLWIAGFLATLGMIAVWEGRRNRPPRAAVRTRIADCKDGELVAIRGTIIPIGTLTAPVSRRHCVGYSIVASVGRGQLMRDAVIPFILDDGSGRAVIECTPGPVPTATLDLQLGRDRMRRNPPDLDALARLGIDRPYELWEGALEAGRAVIVYGRVHLVAVPGVSAGSGYRDGSVDEVHIVRPVDDVIRIAEPTS